LLGPLFVVCACVRACACACVVWCVVRVSWATSVTHARAVLCVVEPNSCRCS
jgi:hypothetical protein